SSVAARYALLRARRISRRDADRAQRARASAERPGAVGCRRADRDRTRPQPARGQRSAAASGSGGRVLSAENSMRYSPMVERIAGRGSGAWSVHMEANRRCEAGEDIIFLTVGDPDQDPPAA